MSDWIKHSYDDKSSNVYPLPGDWVWIFGTLDGGRRPTDLTIYR